MSMQKCRWIITVIGCLIFIPLSNAVGAVQSDAVLRIGWGSDAITLDPVLQGDKQSVAAIYHIHDALIELTPKDFSVQHTLLKTSLLSDSTDSPRPTR